MCYELESLQTTKVILKQLKMKMQHNIGEKMGQTEFRCQNLMNKLTSPCVHVYRALDVYSRGKMHHKCIVCISNQA